MSVACPDVSLLRESYLTGETALSLGKVFGVSRHVIRRWLNDNGMPRNTKVGPRPVEVIKGEKRCTGSRGCGKLLPLLLFTEDAHTASGYSSACRTCEKRYKAARSEIRKAYHREYYLAHAEAYVLNRGLRRQRKLGNNSELTAEDRAETSNWLRLIRDDPCYYCGKVTEKMHFEHLVPVARGGTDVWFNLVRSCADCNFSKYDKTYEEFVQLRALEAVK